MAEVRPHRDVLEDEHGLVGQNGAIELRQVGAAIELHEVHRHLSHDAWMKGLCSHPAAQRLSPAVIQAAIVGGGKGLEREQGEACTVEAAAAEFCIWRGLGRGKEMRPKPSLVLFRRDACMRELSAPSISVHKL